MAASAPVRSAQDRAWLAVLGTALAFTLAACAAASEPTGRTGLTGMTEAGPTKTLGPTMSTSPTPSAPSDPTSTPRSVPGTTLIQVVVGETVLKATLRDNAATRSLLDQLPLTLPLQDFGQQEKTSTPPRPLSMDGMPAGDDAEPLDIGYYAPDGVLVFFYAHVGYFNGIARLGHFDEPIDTLVDLVDGTNVTIELAR
jgi:hypothetical protein